MISLIIQNEFINDLFLLSSQSDEIDSFIKFLRKDLPKYEVICDFSKIEEYIKASEENPIWEMIADKINSISYNDNLDNDIKNLSYNSSIGQHNIFMVNTNKQETEKLSQQTGYAFFCIDNVSTEWPKFKSCKNGIQFKITNDPIIPNDVRLDSWSKLLQFSTPINSIIIFDKYLMVDKTNQKLKDNLYPFLEILTSNNKTIRPLQITIISEFGNDCIKSKHQGIIDYLNSKNISNIEINIIKHHKGFYPSNFEGLHSRFILTNYFHYKCDDSFNFFKSNGNVNNDADLRINLNIVKKNQHFYQKEVNDLKAYLAKIKNDPTYPSPEYREMFYPSNTNPLLN